MKRTLQQRQSRVPGSYQTKKEKAGFSERVERWRKGWVVAFLGMVAIVFANLSYTVYSLIKDESKEHEEKKNAHRLGAVLHQELHGHRTMELESADPNETTADDVDLAFECALINLGCKPIQIAGYLVEVEFNGHWIRFGHIPLRKPRSLITHTIANPVGEHIDVTNTLLDDLIRVRALSPGESMDGWVFLRMEREPNHQFILEQIRLIIWDLEGRTYVIQPKLINERQYREVLNNSVRLPDRSFGTANIAIR